MAFIRTTSLDLKLRALEAAIALRTILHWQGMPPYVQFLMSDSFADLQALKEAFNDGEVCDALSLVLRQQVNPEDQTAFFEQPRSAEDALIELRDSLLRSISGEGYFDTLPQAFTFVPKIKALRADIAEAENCRRLKRHTACVFHLSRVCEALVRALAKKVGVHTQGEDRWHVLSGRLGSYANNMPGTTAKEREARKLLSAVSLALGSVRLAHRNDVMHPGRLSTEEEAVQMFPQVILAVQAGEKFLAKRP
jgi:hypothetical protein